MIRKNILPAILFCSLLASVICLDGYQRRFVFQLSRHGARAPWDKTIGPNVNDIFEEKWPGDSELTGVGLRQQYLLGYKNRISFNSDKFLNETFDPNEIYVVSTDFNRTIMSINAQLNGLYPPPSGPVLNEAQRRNAVPPVDFNFTSEQDRLDIRALPSGLQVFPVHLFDRSAHDFYLHDADVCRPVRQMMINNTQNKTIVDFLTKFNNDYGSKLKNIPSLQKYDLSGKNYDHSYLFFDTFVADYTDARALTALKDAGINATTLAALNETTYEFMNNDMFIHGFGDKDGYLGRMSMSPTFEKILNWTNRRIEYDINKKEYIQFEAPKVVLFSGHDTNLVALQIFLNKAFGLNINRYPSYASALSITLFRANTPSQSVYTSADYKIQIHFNDILYTDTMSYDDFNSKVKASIVSREEIAKYCDFPVVPQPGPEPVPGSDKAYTGFMIATIILGILTFILLIATIVLYRKHKATTDVVVNVDYNRV